MQEINANFVAEKLLSWRSSRMIFEKDWFENELFSQGIHHVYYDQTTGSLRTFQLRDKQPLRVIDKYNVILNWLVNSLTKNEPRPEARLAYGEEITTENREQIKVANIFMQWFWKNEWLSQVMRDVVKDWFKKGISWLQVAFNDTDKNWIWEAKCTKQSTWSIYPDPNGKIKAEDWTFDWKYIIKEVLCDIDEIRNNPDYNETTRNNVQEYNQIDPNSTRANLLSFKNPQLQNKTGMWLIQEVYYKKYEIKTIDLPMEEDGEEDEETIKSKRKKREYMVCSYFRKVYSWDLLLQDETPLDINAFPFFGFQPVREDWEVYLKPWMSRVIPLNKIIDMILTKMETRVRTMNVGRIYKHKNTVVDIINDKEWQIIEWTWTRRPEDWSIVPITWDLFSFNNSVNEIMQDVWMFHVESAWWGGSQSWIALAQKQAWDIFNVTEASDNLAKFVGAVFKYILALASRKYIVTRTIYDDEWKAFTIIWDTVENSPKDAIKIKEFDSIDIKIVPAWVYSDIQLKQDLIELMQMKLVDPTTVLEAYKVGETRKILERLEDEQLKAQGLDPKTERASRKAQKDFADIVKGKAVEMPEFENDNEKWIYVQYFVQNIENQKYPDAVAKRLAKHLKKVMESHGMMATQPMWPETNTMTWEQYQPTQEWTQVQQAQWQVQNQVNENTQQLWQLVQ